MKFLRDLVAVVAAWISATLISCAVLAAVVGCFLGFERGVLMSCLYAAITGTILAAILQRMGVKTLQAGLTVGMALTVISVISSAAVFHDLYRTPGVPPEVMIMIILAFESIFTLAGVAASYSYRGIRQKLLPSDCPCQS